MQGPTSNLRQAEWLGHLIAQFETTAPAVGCRRAREGLRDLLVLFRLVDMTFARRAARLRARRRTTSARRPTSSASTAAP
jgi:hypothetical protein